jgi:hypothetical protein
MELICRWMGSSTRFSAALRRRARKVQSFPTADPISCTAIGASAMLDANLEKLLAPSC